MAQDWHVLAYISKLPFAFCSYRYRHADSLKTDSRQYLTIFARSTGVRHAAAAQSLIFKLT